MPTTTTPRTAVDDWAAWLAEHPERGEPRAARDNRPVPIGPIPEGTYRCRVSIGRLTEVLDYPAVEVIAEPIDGPRARIVETEILPGVDTGVPREHPAPLLRALGINHPADLAELLDGAGPEITATVELSVNDEWAVADAPGSAWNEIWSVRDVRRDGEDVK